MQPLAPGYAATDHDCNSISLSFKAITGTCIT